VPDKQSEGANDSTPTPKELKVDAKLDRAKGKLKEKAGQATGDKKLEGKGHLDQAKGKAKEALGEVKKGADNLTSQS
jgi:uncharacterized protein YjbJ (UPF0337 family)